MHGTLHVIARFVAKAGQESALKSVLNAAIPPTRRELGCYRYDLMTNETEPRDFCFIERWDDDAAFDEHLETAHAKTMLQKAEDLLESPPEIRRYRLV
jgi:quinol monooxygenase YgiN